MLKFSERNSSETVKGQFHVTYKARSKWTGKVYETVHLNPICSGTNPNEALNTADGVNDFYQKRYKGNCPFNADTEFEVVRIQQRR